jgi:hypothetical protein
MGRTIIPGKGIRNHADIAFGQNPFRALPRSGVGDEWRLTLFSAIRADAFSVETWPGAASAVASGVNTESAVTHDCFRKAGSLRERHCQLDQRGKRWCIAARADLSTQAYVRHRLTGAVRWWFQWLV